MIYIVTGAIESGKTSLVYDWSKDRDDVHGILTPNNHLGLRYLMDLSSYERFPMQADINEPATISVGRYHFYASTFNIGNQILETALDSVKNGFIVIDELGKLELKDLGFYSSARSVIKATQNNPNLHSVLIIRSYLLEAIKDHFNIVSSQPIDLKKRPMSIGNCVT